MDNLSHLLGIFVKAVFIENMALAFFLGMCTFLAASKKVDTSQLKSQSVKTT